MYCQVLACLLFLHFQAGNALAMPGYAGAEIPGLGPMQGRGEVVARNAKPEYPSQEDAKFTPVENPRAVMPRDDAQDEPESLEAFLNSIGPKPDTLPDTGKLRPKRAFLPWANLC